MQYCEDIDGNCVLSTSVLISSFQFRWTDGRKLFIRNFCAMFCSGSFVLNPAWQMRVRKYRPIHWSLGLRCLRLTIHLAKGPIVSISDKFSISDMFMLSHGPQFRPIGALLGGLSRPQPISDPFYECLELSWLAFQCLVSVAFNMYFLHSINDNIS
jgi:hypothetical protein